MTREENEIMRDAFFFLRDHIDPPAKGSPASNVFWDRAAQEISELGEMWNNHPLALEMKTSTGWMNIDLTSVIKAYCKDGMSSTMRLWGYGTGGSSSNSNFRGYNPSSSYSSQRPYLLLTYNDSMARIYSDGEWKAAVPYVYHNGVWEPAVIQMFNNSAWR